MDISVVIPVYKAKDFISKAVSSAHGFEEVKEIVLVEDGSSDGTYEECVAVAAAYSKVRLCRHPNGENRGAGASRNLGIERSVCEYVAFLDADDLYLSNRFDAEREVFSNRPDVDGVYGAILAECLTDRGKEMFRSLGMSALTTISVRVDPHDLPYVLLGMHPEARGHIHLDSLTVRRSVFDRIGLINPALKYGEDTEWILRLAFKCRLVPGMIESPVALRGVHDSNHITDVRKLRKNRYSAWKAIFDWVSVNDVPEDVVEACRLRYLSWKTHHDSFFQGLRSMITLRRDCPEIFDHPDYVRRVVVGVFGDSIFSGLVYRGMMRSSGSVRR